MVAKIEYKGQEISWKDVKITWNTYTEGLKEGDIEDFANWNYKHGYNEAEKDKDDFIKEIRFKFLKHPNPKSIINKFSIYDENKSYTENCIDFLKKMEELWNLLNIK